MNSVRQLISGSEKYDVIYSRKNEDEPDGFTGVFINEQYGRFGNNIKQIKNAVRLVDFLGVNVIAISQAIFCEWFPRFARHTFNGYDFIFIDNSSELDDGMWLSSNFFDIAEFNSVLEDFDDVSFSNLISTILDFGHPKKLSIHIRSGDIFVDKPHPSYVQPSLEYYKIAIMDFISCNSVNQISIVCEDMRNPIIHKLIEYLSSSGYRFVVNCSDFLSGFDELRRSDCVVFGFGSFAYPVLYTGINLKYVYFPDYEVEGLKLAKKLSLNVKFITLYDFIKVGSWLNSPDQRDILLTHKNCSAPIVF
jgi:hypothetical protein